MNDLIKLTLKEQLQINDILPDNIRTFQLYQQPALNSFILECSDDKNSAKVSYTRANESVIRDVKNRFNVEMDISATVIGTQMLYSAALKRFEPAVVVFGYTADRRIIYNSYSPSFYDISQHREDWQRFCDGIIWTFESIQYLLLHHKELLQFSVASEPSKHSGKKKKGGKTKKSPPQKTRLYRLVHLTDEQTEELKKTIHDEHEKRKMERHCTAWGVRGHYRHYKSGKVAYIKPHVRGKEKSSYQGREYVLLPKDILNQQSE